MSNVKNLQAFEKLIGCCTGFEGKYNPGQQNLQVNALATLLNNAQQAIHGVRQAETAYDNATNQRETLHRSTRLLATRAVSALRAHNVDAFTLADANTALRMIQGKVNRQPVPAAEATEVKTPRRARGFDYVTQARYFADLVETISKVPGYAPSEPELTVTGLVRHRDELAKANKRVARATVALRFARNHRDAVLYGSKGLYLTARATKDYVLSVFGTLSAEFKAVRGLRFTKSVTS